MALLEVFSLFLETNGCVPSSPLFTVPIASPAHFTYFVDHVTSLLTVYQNATFRIALDVYSGQQFRVRYVATSVCYDAKSRFDLAAMQKLPSMWVTSTGPIEPKVPTPAQLLTQKMIRSLTHTV